MDAKENEEFTQYLMGAVREAEKLGYRPQRFKGMLNADGGYQTVQRILASGRPSDGFTKLLELGEVKLTCEAIIVESRWRPYFDEDLLARAEKLLRQVDYPFKRFLPVEPSSVDSQRSDLDTEVVAPLEPQSEGARAASSRKQFLESQGATCRNWTWSWSFIIEAEKTIIFGAWDTHHAGNRALILSEDWKISRRGRKQPGYSQSREHIRLVEEEGYKLMTFPMTYSEIKEEGDVGPAKIDGFLPELTQKSLIRVGGSWYASDDEWASNFPEELEDHELVEGASKTVSVNAYERNSEACARCLAHHGYACLVCGFSFESTYGELGKKYMHVHHVLPLSEVKAAYVVDPIKDLAPVCPNCHAMIHVTRPCLSIEQLKSYLAANKLL
jgi:5-methylcytosine-specific restriction protein A